jgi:2-polyprenyl-6-methoxyphenol hydroxylase-like FAD-dependent oxidoreductase
VIGIVGAGISGMHLALRLQQRGIATTVYADRGPEDVAKGRPQNLAVRFDNTLVRERELGVDHWHDPDYGWYGAKVQAVGTPIDLFGRVTQPAQSVDFRVYLPQLMADYVERGGTIEIRPPDLETITDLTERHELVVVSSGRQSVGELFPRDADRSPFTTPQRMLCAGLYRGVAPMPERGMQFQLCPEVGEIFSTRFLSAEGIVHGINIETIPGGPIEFLAGLRYDEDPGAFTAALLKVFAEHAPGFRERIDEHEFDLLSPNDLLQGGIVPTVRKGWAAIGERHVVALGDAWIVNDPIAGQGANLGSHSAFVLADAIIAGPPYDEAFCRRVESAMWEYARPVTEWSNAFLQPPPPHALEILVAASHDQRIADGFIEMFNDPPAMWQVLATPAGAADWLKTFA